MGFQHIVMKCALALFGICLFIGLLFWAPAMKTASVTGEFALGVVVGTIGVGGLVLVVGSWQWWRVYSRESFLHLHKDLLILLAMHEAWILDGPDYEHAEITTSDEKHIPTLPVDTTGKLDTLHFKRVELRAVFDDAVWTPLYLSDGTTRSQLFDFCSGGRRWILRARLEWTEQHIACAPWGYKVAYKNLHGADPRCHPALISSRGTEEIRAWLERAAVAHGSVFLTRAQREELNRWIFHVASQDRLDWLGDRLSPRVRAMLAKLPRDRFPTCLVPRPLQTGEACPGAAGLRPRDLGGVDTGTEDAVPPDNARP